MLRIIICKIKFLSWKITRFDKWMSDEQKRMDEKKRMKNFSDLK